MTTALRRALAWVTGTRATSQAWAGAEHAETLAAYSAANARHREAERELRALRKLVDEIPPDAVFGGWRKRFGSSRKIVDREAVEKLLAPHGLEVPMTESAPSLIVEYVGDRHENEKGV